MKYIESLREGMRISEVYLCKSKQIQLTKAGKEYGSLTLQDKTGLADAKIWDLRSPGIEDFEAVGYVAVEADVTSFNGSLQLNIRRIRRAREGEYIAADYLPVSAFNIDEMYEALKKEISLVKNRYLHALLQAVFVEDKELAQRFKYSSAAKNVHHSFVGGLLEHSLSVARLCKYYCSTYPILSYDLLITSALFHDLGKTREISAFPENDYTDTGQLLGHIIIAVEIIHEKAKQIEGFPPKLLDELKHCILAHHGELEYGSPKRPALIEALALSLADNTDAKIQTMKEILLAANDNREWLGYSKLFESNIRKTSLKE